MTDRRDMNQQDPHLHDPSLNTGAYALNALDAQEREQFEAYLDQSEELRTEVTGLSDTAVLLGLSSRPVTPSADLKFNLMALLDSTPQLGAVDAPSIIETPAVPSIADQRRISSLAADRRPSHTHRAEGRARARWFSKPAGALVAAAAAAALIVGGLGGALLASSNDRLQQLQAADDLQTTVADVSGGGTATVLWSDELQRSAVLTDGLPELDGDRVYQLWYIDEDGAVSAGTLDASGTRLQVLDGEREADDVVGITVEPAGGSTSPTTTPIMTTSA